jgi:hypothetical protein
MPVLMLARGDPAAKDLLRAAIEARYGFRPPTLETLELAMKGRVHSKVGLITTWLPIDFTVRLKFPQCIAWEYVVRPLGLPVRRAAEAFDGTALRRKHTSTLSAVTNPAQTDAVQKRLWALAAILLMPLTEHYVELTSAGERVLNATHRDTGNTAQITLKPDNSISSVEIPCYNPAAEKEQLYRLVLSGGSVTLNDLILPAKIASYWDNEADSEFELVRAIVNPPLDTKTFTMA